MVLKLITPNVLVRRVTSVRAAALGRYPNSRMASMTRSRVAGRTLGRSLSTRDTDAIDTPATRATS